MNIDHDQLTGRLKIQGVPARTAKRLASQSIADKAKQQKARRRTAKAIARRKRLERLPDPATLASFDASLIDEAEVERLLVKHGLRSPQEEARISPEVEPEKTVPK